MSIMDVKVRKNRKTKKEDFIQRSAREDSIARMEDSLIPEIVRNASEKV